MVFSLALLNGAKIQIPLHYRILTRVHQGLFKSFGLYFRKYLTPLYPPLSPQINWKMLLGGLFPQEPEPHDVLIVHNPNYLRKLGRIIALFGKR